MFQDRRKHPRYPVLIKAQASVDRERFEVVCTDIGPASAFCSCRVPLKVGQRVALELRPGGLGSPIVEVHGTVLRTVGPGGSWPSGFALAWILARCELGAEPLLRLLGQVLRLPGVTEHDIAVAGLVAEFDLEAWLARGSRPALAVPSVGQSSTAVRRVQGSWSPPVLSSRGEPDTARITTAPTARGTPLAADRPPTGPQAIRRTPAQPMPAQPLAGPAPMAGPTRSPTQPLSAAHLAAPAPSPRPPLAPVPAPAAAAPSFHVPAQAPAQAHPAFGAATAAQPAGPSAAWRPPPFSARPGSVAAEPASAAPRVGEPASKSGLFDAADRTPAETIVPDLATMDSGAVAFEGSGIFDSLKEEPSLAIGRRGDSTTANPSDDRSQSWPVYALAPGERRQTSRHGQPGTNPGAADILSSIRSPIAARPETDPDQDIFGREAAAPAGGGRALSASGSFDAVGSFARGLSASGTFDAPQAVAPRAFVGPTAATATARSAQQAAPRTESTAGRPPPAPPVTTRTGSGPRDAHGPQDVIVPHRHYTVDGRRAASGPVTAMDNVGGSRPSSASGVVRVGTPGGVPTIGLSVTTGIPRTPAGAIGGSSSGNSASRAPTADSRVMRPVETPVTFLRRNQFVPGRVVGLALLAVAVVTDEPPPELDEPLTINLPVAIDGVYRTIYLSGKLLQVATDTEQGRRFVMHIERVEEGKHRGAFKQLLAALA